MLQTLKVVGLHNGLKPRSVLNASISEVQARLAPLEHQLPVLLELQKGAAVAATSPPIEAPGTAAQPEAAQGAEAPAVAEPEQAPTPAAPSPSATADPAPAAALPQLPRRDRTVERPHPGNLETRPAPAEQTATDQDVAQLLEGHEDRLKEVSERLIAGKEAREATHPAPPRDHAHQGPQRGRGTANRPADPAGPAERWRRRPLTANVRNRTRKDASNGGRTARRAPAAGAVASA